MIKYKHEILIAFFSMLLCIVAMEVGFRLIYDHNLSGIWRVFDERGLHLNKSEGSAVHNSAGYSATYSFRYPHLRGGYAIGGKYRILLLGDSFTFGWLLNWQDTYAGRLEAHIQKAFGPVAFEVANAAAGGWGLDSYLAYLEGYGQELDPDIVLVFLNTADIGRSVTNGLYRVDREELIPSKKSIPLLKRIFQVLPFYDYLISRSYLLDALRRAYLRLRYGRANEEIVMGPGAHSPDRENVTRYENDNAVVLAKRIFERMIEWCEMRKAQLVVMTTAWHNPPYEDVAASERFMAQATEFFESHDVPFFDGSPILVRRKHDRTEPVYIERDGHPNEKGARLIAEVNWAFLKAELAEFCDLNECPVK